MKFFVLSIATTVILAGCGGTWFPDDSTTASLTISPSSLADAPTGLSYSQTLSATGGISPYTWTINSGTVPAGLTLSEGGILAGIPTDPAPIPATTPTYTFSVKATDSSTTPLTATKSFSISTPISAKDSTGKVFAHVVRFDATTGLLVTITNTDSSDHTILAVAANYDAAGLEQSNSAFDLTLTTVSAGTSSSLTNKPPSTFTVNNWRIKSVTIQ